MGCTQGFRFHFPCISKVSFAFQTGKSHTKTGRQTLEKVPEDIYVLTPAWLVLDPMTSLLASSHTRRDCWDQAWEEGATAIFLSCSSLLLLCLAWGKKTQSWERHECQHHSGLSSTLSCLNHIFSSPFWKWYNWYTCLSTIAKTEELPLRFEMQHLECYDIEVLKIQFIVNYQILFSFGLFLDLGSWLFFQKSRKCVRLS